MRNRTIYAAVLLATFALSAACDKTPQLSSEYSTDPNAVLIDASVGALTRSNPLGENQTKFNAGDRISVVHISANKHVDYTYNGTSWVPEGDDYLVWQTDKKNIFRLQYPLREIGEFFKNQSTLEEMSKSDLMVKSVEFDKIPDDRRLVAKLERQRSLVTVKIVGFNDEFGADAKITDLKLHLWDGSQGDEILPVTPYIRDAQGVAQPAGTEGRVGYSYTAIGRNDYNRQLQNEPLITMTVAGKTLTVANPAPMEIGKHYTYELTVGKESVKISGVTVEDWAQGGTVDGTFETVTDRYSVWDGTSVEDPQGYGTEEYPYVIDNAAQLAGFAQLVNGGDNFADKYIKLDANIDLNNMDWTPIGTTVARFMGHFNGNGNVVINMRVSDYTDDAGLFGAVRDAEISSVVLRNGKVSVAGNQLAALLVGRAERVTISNCKVDGSVSSPYMAAGILAEPKGKVNISDCEADVDCFGKDCAGGIVADGGDANIPVNIVIKSCVVRGTVSSQQHSVGGIAAHLQGSVKISDCVSYADLKCNDILYFSSIGGIVGKLDGGTVENCTVYSRIDCTPCGGNGSVVGGVFGTATDVTVSGLKFEGYMGINKDCNNTTDIEYSGYFIGKIQNSITVTDKCTYKKSGTKDLKAVASYPEGVDITKIEAI